MLLFRSVHVPFQIPNVELLHAVVGLYDVSLTEMTPDVLYNTVCGKGARTIIILRDVKGIQYNDMHTPFICLILYSLLCKCTFMVFFIALVLE